MDDYSCYKSKYKSPIKFDYGLDTSPKDFQKKSETYQSSYKSAFTKKCDCYGSEDKINVPHALKYNMNFTWAEKLRSAPVRKRHENISEMKKSYKLHLLDETAESSGILNDLRPQLLCNLGEVARDTLSKTDANQHCVQKLMDPYISTQQYDYIDFDPNEVAKYRSKSSEPAQLIPIRKSPIYDESFLGPKFMDRFFRKKPVPVPHSGFTTEVRDNYKLPLDELSHKKQLYCSSLFRTRQTKGEVMSVPAMYHSEYNHYGHHWPLSSII